ncbi:precorrin-6A/cobalt-precorrin-6A reductase [Roseovarius sp. M141]|uniref:precorrin-6A/cobalt-precorrin-6A reductase n=1 Tax=Roseovarius sp. M141 TaxID=2583806 RepID=UPI0020CF2285|nr:precorrin-6A/cobalt-precorrin-6A reductase [Roseovarius sp. M141]MCQ0091359.1 cobalt-precorrin-6A reductase [Roseovarius sp. M141]
MTLLLLAGTGEARQIAEALADRCTDFTVWLPGEGRIARDWPIAPARGTLADCLNDPAITAVLDATHPFSTDATQEATHICAERGLPYCLLWRPEWRAQSGDRWTHVLTEAEAAKHIPPGATVFVATGREGLAHFAALRAAHVYCRQIGAPDAPFPFPNGQYLIQNPPFPVEEEIALFQRLEIDWLVTRNTGSTRAVTKLTAARQLGLNVLMIDRPAPPDAPRAASVAEALEWAPAR